MPEWLVSVSVGPVGSFIAGGRRSRDLWWGSTWLSECTRAVATSLESAGARLLLPGEKRLLQIRELLERNEPLIYGGRITNRVLAVVTAPAIEQVAEKVREAETAARSHLASTLEDVRRRIDQLAGARAQAIGQILDEDAFWEQLEGIRNGDFVEIYAAWTPYGGDPGGARDRADVLLDARKAARLFTLPVRPKGLRRKSDLDPGRDSVLRSGHQEDDEGSVPAAAARRLARNRLGIRPDEDLDAVGLGRRIAALQGGPSLERLPFPPLSRVAADPWLHEVAADPECRGALDQVRRILREAADDPLFFAWCSPARDPEASWRQQGGRGQGLFPFDASILMEGGLDALVQEVRRLNRGSADDEVTQALKRLDSLRGPIDHLHHVHGEPHPYYGLLAMDGDGVGAALGQARRPEDFQRLVRALDTFADVADEVVSKRHHGCAFYVGGDELTAYLPASTAAAAALDLALRFSDVKEAFRPIAPVSLSGGLVLAHVKTDLRATRARAREALGRAKERRARSPEPDTAGRGWLEVVELPRSGVERGCYGPLETLAQDLAAWQRLLAGGRLSGRSPHLLLSFRDLFADSQVEPGHGHLGLNLARHRLLQQSVRSDREEPDPALKRKVDDLKSWAEAESFAAELTVAARILEASMGRVSAEPEVET